MPRYYELTLYNPDGTVATRRDHAKTPYQWGTNLGGTFSPGSLNLSFSCPVTYMAQPTGAATLILEGVGLEDLQQGNQLAGLNLTLRGGMTAGLPLANAKQAGILLKGQVWQSWGNWAGTQQALVFNVLASAYTPSKPGNFALIWKKGQHLYDGLSAMLTTVFPGMPQKITLRNNLVATEDTTGHYGTLESFSSAINIATESDTDPGVNIWISKGVVYASDQTQPTASSVITQLEFNDLIGQPTWIDQNVIQIRTVLRADLEIGQFVQMPRFTSSNGNAMSYPNAPGFITSSLQSLPSSLKYQVTMKGAFQIQSVLHTGESRNPDGTNWSSTFNCVPTSITGEQNGQ